MKNFIIVLLLVLSLKSYAGDGFPPLVQVNPGNIDTNTEIYVTVSFSPCAIPTEDFFIAIDGSNIQLVFASTSFSPCPPGLFALDYNLGMLPEGQYTVTVFQTPGDEPPTDLSDPNLILNQYGEPVSFGVGAPRVVPGLNTVGLLFLMFTFMVSAYLFRKKPKTTSSSGGLLS